MYAEHCDFPGENVIKGSCELKDTYFECGNKCSKSVSCLAFIAITTKPQPAKYWCCLKTGDKETFSWLKAREFKSESEQSVCGTSNLNTNK
jgi:hypothetical protein